VKKASKAGARALNYSIKQEKGGKERAGKRLGSEPQSVALRSGPIFRTARTALAKPTSSSQHPREGSGTKAHDRNQEVGVCPCALRRTEKRHWSVRKSTCRSQSQHFAIRSFLREARRANQSLLPNKLLMLVLSRLVIQKRLLNRVSKGHSLPNVFRSPQVNQKVEETAQTDREGQELPGSERAADVAEDETRPESDPVVDETRHDVGPTSELETLVKEEEGKQQSDIDSVTKRRAITLIR